MFVASYMSVIYMFVTYMFVVFYTFVATFCYYVFIVIYGLYYNTNYM